MRDEILICFEYRVRFPNVRSLLTVFRANKNHRLYKVCVAYLKQRCDNRAKYYITQKTPPGSNTGAHASVAASPLPLDLAASAEGFMEEFMITPNNDEVQPRKFNIPLQGYLRHKIGWLTVPQIRTTLAPAQ
jgi:hypothetical protein